jgi:hypothetical protein
MEEPSNSIFIEDCRELNGTWVVSGLVYLNDIDEPQDMEISREFTEMSDAIEYANECARGSKLPSILLLDGNEVDFVRLGRRARPTSRAEHL